ncbi:MAG: glycosyltransferase family 4 protein [Bacilli bacterium]
MKIAHVTATFPPYWAGTGNVAYHNARILHERGHQVTVFTARPTGRDPMTFPFRVEYLNAPFRIGNAPFTPRLLTMLRGFDIIHLHYPYIFGAELTCSAARQWRMPVVATYHNDLLSPGWKGSAFQAYSRLNQPWVLNRCDCVAATSLDYAKHSLLGRWSSGDIPVEEIPNGVDTDQFCPAPPEDRTLQSELGLRPATPIVLFVGAMDHAHFFKGIPVLIEALQRIPEAHGVLVGEGDLRMQFEDAARRLAPGRVTFTGGVKLDRLIHLYQSADVTVLPSVTMGEAFGVVLLESMACGTPVVASDLPGVRTVVEHGVDGELARPGDAQSLAQAIRRVLEPDLNRQMGRRGREKVERKYAWSVVADGIESIYQKVLGS